MCDDNDNNDIANRCLIFHHPKKRQQKVKFIIRPFLFFSSSSSSLDDFGGGGGAISHIGNYREEKKKGRKRKKHQTFPIKSQFNSFASGESLFLKAYLPTLNYIIIIILLFIFNVSGLCLPIAYCLCSFFTSMRSGIK